jgi:beta-galactosidase
MERGAKLYTLRIAIVADEYADELTRRIGLREFRFDPEEGFFLNGERIQLKGFNQHADLGPLGMAVNEGAIRRQLDIMREMGANAIRTSHNPPAPELLDACDEMGIFVWDECFDKWDDSAVKGDFVQEEFIARHLRQLVRRDRLHPCVFVWSMGNEIQTARATKFGDVGWWIGPIALGTNRERCAQYRHAIREEDRTRPVGIGSAFGHALTGRGDYLDLDIAGWNYGRVYAKAHELAPQIPVLCSESASAVSEFGFYADDLPTCKTNYAHEVHRIDSYDFNAAPWSDVPDREFVRMELDPYCSGEFVWTGIDYLGEPTPFKDSRSSYFGICDLLGFPKDRYYLYRSYWNTEDFTLHIVPGHWNFSKKIGKKIPVFVYTSAPEAELFVNGKSMGRRRKDPKAGTLDDYYSVLPRYRLMWMEVPYEPGEVKAVAYDAQGRKLGEQVRRTAGVPVKVVLVTLADKDGNFVPDDDRRIHFQVEGCRILAVGNSDPRGYDRFMKTDSHPLKFGRAGVFLEIEPGAKWKLTATAEGCDKAQKAAE